MLATDPSILRSVRRLIRDDREIAAVLPMRAGVCGPAFLVADGDGARIELTPMDVLRPVVRGAHREFALVHTHLADEPPSRQDLAFTRRLVAAAAVVGTRLVAHVVIGPTRRWDCLREASVMSSLRGSGPSVRPDG